MGLSDLQLRPCHINIKASGEATFLSKLFPRYLVEKQKSFFKSFVRLDQSNNHFIQDELNLYYDVNDESRVSIPALIGPAFTTYSYLNSGYRIYKMDGDYDGTTNALLDAETYFLNITGRSRGHATTQARH